MNSVQCGLSTFTSPTPIQTTLTDRPLTHMYITYTFTAFFPKNDKFPNRVSFLAFSDNVVGGAIGWSDIGDLFLVRLNVERSWVQFSRSIMISFLFLFLFIAGCLLLDERYYCRSNELSVIDRKVSSGCLFGLCMIVWTYTTLASVYVVVRSLRWHSTSARIVIYCFDITVMSRVRNDATWLFHSISSCYWLASCKSRRPLFEEDARAVALVSVRSLSYAYGRPSCWHPTLINIAKVKSCQR